MFAVSLTVLTTVVVLARPGSAADEAPPEATPTEAQTAKFPAAQIEQLVAPVALYPDPILVQVLMASTYPLEVVEADRWRAKSSKLTGDELDKALESHDWDPSIKALTHFPDLLKRMSENLDWTKDLGDAFLAQKDDVLNAVQRLRAKAQESGALKTTKEQVVTREVVKEKEIIQIEPADPEVVYVPQYAPQAVYGAPASPTPYYPAMYAYPPGYLATTSLLSFGAGMAVGAAVWGDCDWDNHDVYNNGGGGAGNQNQNVNINKEKNVDRSRERTRGEGGRGERGEGGRGQGGAGGRQKWQHSPEHRRGVGYRDNASAKKYGGGDRVAARDRANSDASRGFDRGQGGARPSQRPDGGRGQGASRPGGGAGQAGGGPGSAGRQPGRPSQQPAARPGGGAGSKPSTGNRGGAFGGYESGRSTREASARGASSRGGSSYAGGGRGGGGGGGFGGRGGGGGGRGGGGRGGGGGGGRGGGGRGGRR
jgi:hypothetical protein